MPVGEPGTGCGGDSAERKLHAAVPGSSLPSGQSQKSSLTLDSDMTTDGVVMQVKVSFESL